MGTVTLAFATVSIGLRLTPNVRPPWALAAVIARRATSAMKVLRGLGIFTLSPRGVGRAAGRSRQSPPSERQAWCLPLSGVSQGVLADSVGGQGGRECESRDGDDGYCRVE